MKKIAPYEMGEKHPFIDLLKRAEGAGDIKKRLVVRGLAKEFSHVPTERPYSARGQEELILSKIAEFKQETTGREQELWEELQQLISEKPGKKEEWLDNQLRILHEIAEERKNSTNSPQGSVNQ